MNCLFQPIYKDPSIFKAAEVLALKTALKEKDEEIAGLKDERDCGFAEVARLESALRPYKHREFEQTWGTSITVSNSFSNVSNPKVLYY